MWRRSRRPGTFASSLDSLFVANPVAISKEDLSTIRRPLRCSWTLKLEDPVTVKVSFIEQARGVERVGNYYQAATS